MAMAIALSACQSALETRLIGVERDEDYDQKLVVSEVMTHNLTTMLNGEGKPTDWVELQNISDESISLKGYMLYVVDDTQLNDSASTASADSIVAEKADSMATEAADSVQKASCWTFPDYELPAGEHVLVFVGKKEDTKGRVLQAKLKLPADGGCVKVLTPDGLVLGEMTYGDMDTDESMQRTGNGLFATTFQPTPGFANDAAGWEAFLSAREKQFTDALKIWEVKPNGSADEQWVEVKNTSNAEISLKDYTLTNKAKELDKWQFPDVRLAPGALYSVRTVGKRRAGRNAELVPFKMSDKEAVLLVKGGVIVDAVSARGTLRDCTRGRVADKQGLFYFDTPTQNAENTSKAYRGIAPVPTLSKKAGVYKEKEMSVEIKAEGRKVHYTTDGSLPTTGSKLYDGPIKLTKSTTLRCLAEGDDNTMHSDGVTSTFLLGEEHTLAVLHITMRHADLFDPSVGIFVEGNHPADIHTVGGDIQENRNANYFQKWVKPAHAEFFDGKEGFSVDCGIKIFGAGSRALPKKSFSLKFDPTYGPSSVKYDFFGDGQPLELEDIVIRCGSDDQVGVMMRDEFFTSLMQAESPTILTQLYRPVAMYINGEYWGLYYLREKIDRHFVGRKLGVSDDSVSILRAQVPELGTKDEFYALHEYLASHDCKSAETYKYMDEHVSLTSLIDGKIGRLYCGDTDIYNVRQVKAKDKDGDQKWYWIFYDVDNAWFVFKSPAFYLRINSGYNGSQPTAFCNTIIDRMLANPQFRDLFLQRLSHHMKHTFSIDNLHKRFDALTETIRPEMKRNCERWPDIMSYDSWEGRVKSFREKFDERGKTMLDGIKQEIGITAEECKKYGL